MPKVGAEKTRRVQIINGVLECICESGMDDFTLDDVAIKAGCSKGVVCYYFKSKKQLQLEAFQAFLSFYATAITRDLSKAKSPEEALKVVLMHGLPEYLDKPASEAPIKVVSETDSPDDLVLSPEKKSRLFVLFYSKAILDEDFQKIIRSKYKKDVEGISSIIGFGVKSGSYNQAVNTDNAAFMLLSVVIGMAIFRAVDFKPKNKKDYEICMEMIKKMLKT